MSASRRLINLAGTLLVLIALVAGTMLTALPIYLESRDLNAQELTVAASNQVLQAQIDALHAQEATMPDMEQELADLHDQLPRIPQLDDVTQLVVKAAGKVKADIQSVDFGAPVPFVARDATTLFDQLPQTATGLAPSTPDADVNGSDGNSSAPADASSDTSADAGAVSDSTPAAAGTTGQLQFPVTVNVTAPDQSAASRFLDELRAGPRLLQIDTVNTGLGEDDQVTLTLTGLVFVSPST